MISSDNRRIAKNTLLLYIRMAITIVIGLYTSRLVLEALGESDYGLYSVVGGIVVVLSFLNSSLSSGTQRFLNYELGKKESYAEEVFKTSLQLHIIVTGIIFIGAETIGLWFLNTQMNILPERMQAANWVYQFSVISCIVSILTVPYNALVTAHEKMGAFAYISLIETFLKLGMVIMLLYVNYDRLILYAGLLLAIGLLNRLIYSAYCRKKFPETKVCLKGINFPLLKSMASFSGWSVIGSLGYISHTQGIAIIINIFFGTVVNAAEGLTNQVNSVITGFVTNFLIALNPQVVKKYAAGDLSGMHTLITRGCRFCYFLMSVFTLPIAFAAPMLLSWWLTAIPPYTVIFIRLTMFITLFNSFTSLLACAQGATGEVRNYQIVLTAIGLLHLPLAWLLFYLGYPPYWAMIIYLVIVIVLQIIRSLFVCHSTGMYVTMFLKEVVLPTTCCTAIALIPSACLHFALNVNEILNAIICEVLLISSIWIIGLNKSEKEFITSSIKQKLHL